MQNELKANIHTHIQRPCRKMALGLFTGKYKFASLAPKRTLFGTVKILNMGIQNIQRSITFSVLLEQRKTS